MSVYWNPSMTYSSASAFARPQTSALYRQPTPATRYAAGNTSPTASPWGSLASAWQYTAQPINPFSPQPNAPAALPGPSRNQGFASLNVNFTNDTHEDMHTVGRRVTAFKQLGHQARANGRDLLNIAAGDWNIAAEADQFELNVLLNNMMGINGSTFGNHEFDGGTGPIAKALHRAQFPMFAVNLDLSNQDPLAAHTNSGHLITTSSVFTAPSGQRYGLIGVTVPKLNSYLNPKTAQKNGLKLDSLDFEQSLARIQQEVNRLEQYEGVNKVLLISHMGYKHDKKAAARLGGVDIIVGGHSHTRLEGITPGKTLFTSSRGEPVMVMQTGKDGKSLGQLQAQFDPYGRIMPQQYQLFTPQQFTPDMEAQALIDQYLGKAVTIGTLAHAVETEGARTDGENAAANYLTDTMRQKAQVDIAFDRGTQFRKDLLAGPVTDRDIRTMLPFPDGIAKMRVSGAVIRQALENSAKSIHKGTGTPGILHSSGNFRYSVDKQTGQVTRAELRDPRKKQWVPLQDDTKYTIAIGDFVVSNRKEWPMFNKEQVTGYVEDKQGNRLKLSDVMIERISGETGPINLKKDGRLQVLNTQPVIPASTLAAVAYQATTPMTALAV